MRALLLRFWRWRRARRRLGWYRFAWKQARARHEAVRVQNAELRRQAEADRVAIREYALKVELLEGQQTIRVANETLLCEKLQLETARAQAQQAALAGRRAAAERDGRPKG